MLKTLSLYNYRNFSSIELEFSSGLNLILGENGAGKTSLLEAAYLCGFGRSFKGHKQTFLKMGEDFGKILGIGEQRNEVQFLFIPDGERKIMFNSKRILKISELLGKFPITYIGPGEVMAVAGSPSVRRMLIDSHLCQFDAEYTSLLYHYHRSVRQRNASLRAIANQEAAGGTVLIDAWDEKVAKTGAEIISHRLKFIENLAPIASEIFRTIAGEQVGELSIKYRCTIAENPEIDDLEALFFAKLAGQRNYSMKTFDTKIGPHRDDMDIFLDNLPAKQFASWGQVRMISLALYLGAAKILSEHTQPLPTLLLDDALAELDPNHANAALKFVPNIGQTIVATPHPAQIKNIENAKIFEFSQPGIVVERK